MQLVTVIDQLWEVQRIIQVDMCENCPYCLTWGGREEGLHPLAYTDKNPVLNMASEVCKAYSRGALVSHWFWNKLWVFSTLEIKSWPLNWMAKIKHPKISKVFSIISDWRDPDIFSHITSSKYTSFWSTHHLFLWHCKCKSLNLLSKQHTILWLSGVGGEILARYSGWLSKSELTY